MFWGTVIEPGARIVISAPPNVSQIHITRALPYEAYPNERHRLFIQIREAPPVLVCNDIDGCSLDVKLSQTDLENGPVLYQTEGNCQWALSGEAVEEPGKSAQKTTLTDSTTSYLKYLCSVTLLVTLMNTLILVSKNPVF